MAEKIFRNYIRYDIQAFSLYVKHIDKYRFVKLLRELHDSVIADSIDSDLESVEKHDKMFEPRTEPEEMFWKSCRQLAKFDLETLKKKVAGGSKGGRPKTISKEEKQQAIDDFTNNFGKKIGKNQVQITDDFKLPDIEYFNAYRKNYPTQLIQNVENWLIKSKKNETIDYQWIGNLIQKFNKRKTGNPL